MKLYRTGAIAGLIAGSTALAVLLTACSSSKSDSSTDAAANTAAASGLPITCASGTLKGDGSSAQKNAVQEWTADFKSKCSGITINYQGSGSGAGINGFQSKQLDWAGSDAAIKGDDVTKANANCASGGTAINIPMVVGPISMAYNVSGVDKLTLTPKLLGEIFTGKITSWDNADIKAANSGVSLPSTPIKVITRSDSSGTSFNFSSYLSQVDPADFTEAPAKQWPVKIGAGAKGSAGVAGAVKASDGSIGYVELSAAQDAGVKMAAIDSGDGAVEISSDAASKFMTAGATVTGTAPDLTLKLDYTQHGAGVYPIVLVTYEIVCTKYNDSNIGAMVKAFFSYTSGAGQGSLNDLGYAPLPSDLVTKVQSSVSAIS
ncbi:phosphate ABC transporter substrate-binding protein (PhoT family) [Jatrophihabitans sp. GAS493]|uniref:phosphate ABC transporter substrate-binding protein PstS n=1 Tax=Jatrophihabitans sp. GAS493 TaxID=1907575 RepID=UPI000BB8CC75|nr:phosphate ABC transporter substrate-binding protein PstS [Jatrophihabitans sp. GAS493]SOD70746.1 phosphate ABC transporter substrate-binding protein (PhoT family) [Jatrophihabitans sp. GAS493]